MLTVKDDEVLTRYLLGELPEAEQAQLEERLFQDEDCYDRLRALKADLTDAYVRNELSGIARRQFAHRFLSTPAGQETALFAQALDTLTAEHQRARAMASFAPAPASRWDWLSQLIPTFPNGWQMAMATAVLLLCAGFVWQWYEARRLQEQLARVQQTQQEAARQRQTLQDELARAQQRAAELTGQLATRSQPATVSPTPPAPAQPSVFALLLTPGLVRGDAISERAPLTPDIRRLQLQLLLDADEQFQQYVVEVRTKTGTPVLTQREVTARRTRLGKSLFLNLPAADLTAGEYEVQVQGVTTEGKLELSNVYGFTVTRS